MPNANYQKGYRAELNILHELKTLGYIAARSAASHSAFDVWAVREKDVVLVQAKRGGKPSPCDYKSAKEAKVPDSVIVLVVWFPDGLQAPQVLWYNRLPDWLQDKENGTAPRVRWFVTAPPRQTSMRLV